MPFLHLTSEANSAIRAAADGNSYRQTGIKRDDGTWDVPVEQITLKRLNELRFAGESDSDVIIRLCAGRAS